MSNYSVEQDVRHLKHKLWSTERSGVKLSNWLSIVKSRESPQFPYVQVVCQIPLESSQQRLQLCFRPHPDWRFEHKVMAHKVVGIQFWEFRDSHLGVLKQSVIWMSIPWVGTEYTIRGKVVASPKSGPWWVLWVWVCPWLVLSPKVP
jgi:hypothetical protein